MSWLFRANSCVLLLVYLVNYHPGCDAGKSQHRQGKHTRKPASLNNIMDNLQRSNQLKPKFHHILLGNLTDKLSASRYMMNLYKSLKNHSVEDNSQGFNIANITTTKKVDDADTIMGILNDVPDDEKKPSNFNMKFKFNFTAKMKQNESVAAAEFHIYKDTSQYHWMKNTSFVVQLDVITIPGSPVKLSSELTKRVVHGWETGWQIFDVTSTVDIWIVSPQNNYGLVLKMTTLNNHTPIPVDPAKFGFSGFKGPYQHRPFIVSFFKGDPTERSIILHSSKRKRRSAFSPKSLKNPKKSMPNLCRKRHLYVDFHALNWENWVIAPDGYESSYCDGDCRFNSVSRDNTSNHAMVQTLVHLLNPDTVPMACCTPTKLNAISVLFYDDSQNVILKKFQNMVVRSCGCQ